MFLLLLPLVLDGAVGVPGQLVARVVTVELSLTLARVPIQPQQLLHSLAPVPAPNLFPAIFKTVQVIAVKRILSQNDLCTLHICLQRD